MRNLQIVRVAASSFIGICLIFAPCSVFAQDAATDDSSFGSFFNGDDASGDAAAIGNASSGQSLSISGEASADVRAYLSQDALDAVGDDADAADALEAVPELHLGLQYKGASTEFIANIAVDAETIESFPTEILEEAYMRQYSGDFVIETGKMKLVWGKGDELHVVDLFNANDYTDFIFPDYADRRLAETMVHVAWNSPNGLRAELVWTPTMTADRVPSEGAWAPADAIILKSLVESYAGYMAAVAYATNYAATGSAAAASVAATAKLSDFADGSAVLPDTNQLDYGQYGARLCGTVGILDWGASYYLGHYKIPSVSYALTGTSVSTLDISYDRLQSFGLEGAAVLGPFNFRAEAAYYLTDDIAGDDPAVKNNSVNWVFGFDVGLPVHNMSVNIQTIGQWIAASDKIDSSADVDYDEDGTYTNDKIVVRLADNWLREKIQGEVKLLWGIERGDVVVMPSVEWNAVDQLFLAISGAFFPGAADGEFSAFTDNRFLRLTARYQF